jgi:hypothetical protein
MRDALHFLGFCLLVGVPLTVILLSAVAVQDWLLGR